MSVKRTIRSVKTSLSPTVHLWLSIISKFIKNKYQSNSISATLQVKKNKMTKSKEKNLREIRPNATDNSNKMTLIMTNTTMNLQINPLRTPTHIRLMILRS
jgi:hypothetical protein